MHRMVLCNSLIFLHVLPPLESNVMGAKGSDDDHSSDEETVINRINDDLKGKCPLRTSRDGNKVISTVVDLSY